MPRIPRITLGNHVYHVLNRSARKAPLFVDAEDYQCFERLMREATRRLEMRILAYCLMPTHWHMLLWPFRDGDISAFVKWLTTTHAARWTRRHQCVGGGAVYQARFKSIPVQEGRHLYWVWRSVERNALRANIVERAEDWRWGSLWHRLHHDGRGVASDGPLNLPTDWTHIVNMPQTEAELADFRGRIRLDRPFGCEGWLTKTSRPRGRQHLRNTKK